MITLGKNQIIHADIFDIEIPSGYHLGIADPPYGDTVDEDWDKNWTHLDYLKLANKLSGAIIHGGSCFIWGGIGKPNPNGTPNRNWFKFLAAVEESTDLVLKNVITWNKKRAYGKKSDYLFTREELAWFIKGTDEPNVFNIPLLDEKRGYAGFNPKYPAKSEFKRRTNVWTDVTEVMRGKIHLCEKPQKLQEIIIGTHSNAGDYVLDLFSGSGNVAVVAKNMNRKFTSIERDKKTFDKIVNRLKS